MGLLVSLILKFLSAWRMGFQGAAANRSMDARMSSADLVQRKGLGSALRCLMNSSMAAISCLTDLWAPRLICFSASSAKKRSTLI